MESLAIPGDSSGTLLLCSFVALVVESEAVEVVSDASVVTEKDHLKVRSHAQFSFLVSVMIPRTYVINSDQLDLGVESSI